MAVKNAMTADFLRSAYGGECMAHMRYLTWGEVAEKEGFPNIARLFKAIALAIASPAARSRYFVFI